MAEIKNISINYFFMLKIYNYILELMRTEVIKKGLFDCLIYIATGFIIISAGCARKNNNVVVITTWNLRVSGKRTGKQSMV